MIKWLKRIFFQVDNKMQYTPEELEMLERVERCIKLIKNNSLTIKEARWFTHELPTHYCKEGRYKKEVHNICNNCHRQLWEYCKANKFIDNITYKEFTEHGMIHFKL